MTSPNWSSSAFFLNYDEHGGYFDHIPPPSAPNPDGHVTGLNVDHESTTAPVDFVRYGIRCRS